MYSWELPVSEDEFSCFILLHRDIEVPTGPFQLSRAVRLAIYSCKRRQCIRLYKQELQNGSVTVLVHLVLFGLICFLYPSLPFLKPPPPLRNGTQFSKGKTLEGQRTIMIQILGDAFWLNMDWAPTLNGKFLLTISFGQVPPAGREYKHYSPNPRERNKLPTEMSSCFRIIHTTLSTNSRGLRNVLYLVALAIKTASYFCKIIILANEWPH